MTKDDVIKALGLPDAVIPRAEAMTATRWQCAGCGCMHVTDQPVPAHVHSPCPCGSIGFQKMPEVLQ